MKKYIGGTSCEECEGADRRVPQTSVSAGGGGGMPLEAPESLKNLHADL
jgi:hypothetical protein